jgi:protein-tyrosine phosphatase
MAVEYFRDRTASSGMSHLSIDSAGTLGIVGSPASAEAVETLGDIGIDLSKHRSQGVERDVLEKSDLVIVMTRDHLDELAQRFPDSPDRRLLIRSFEQGAEPDPNAIDLDDPIGKSLSYYRDQFKLIRRCLDNLAIYLRHPA